MNIVKRAFILDEDNVWDYADGIDFCPIFSDVIIESYTKEKFQSVKCYPKTNRKYWIMRDHKKSYLRLGVSTFIDEDMSIYQKVE